MNPSAVLTFETTLDQADGGSRKGSYFQLGVAPSVTFDIEKAKEVEVSFPVTVGMSLSNFYEGPGGQNDVFGYASLGASAGCPCRWIRAGASGHSRVGCRLCSWAARRRP